MDVEAQKNRVNAVLEKSHLSNLTRFVGFSGSNYVFKTVSSFTVLDDRGRYVEMRSTEPPDFTRASDEVIDFVNKRIIELYPPTGDDFMNPYHTNPQNNPQQSVNRPPYHYQHQNNLTSNYPVMGFSHQNPHQQHVPRHFIQPSRYNYPQPNYKRYSPSEGPRVRKKQVEYTSDELSVFSNLKLGFKENETYKGLSGLVALANISLAPKLPSISFYSALSVLKQIFIDLRLTEGYEPVDLLMLLESFIRGIEVGVTGNFSLESNRAAILERQNRDLDEETEPRDSNIIKRKFIDWTDVTHRARKNAAKSFGNEGEFVEPGNYKVTTQGRYNNLKKIDRYVTLEGRHIPKIMFNQYKAVVEEGGDIVRIANFNFDDEGEITTVPDYENFLENIFPSLKESAKKMIVISCKKFMSRCMGSFTMTNKRAAIIAIGTSFGAFNGAGSYIEHDFERNFNSND